MEAPQTTVAWIAREILPHEAIVRHWLAKRWSGVLDVDDVVQEAYCRLSELDSIAHIQNPKAYFFTTARAVAIDMTRAAKLACVGQLTEMDWQNVMDDSPLPDRAAESAQELSRTAAVLSSLSWTCRQVIELRRIHGLSQAETASLLGVSEHVIENHIVRGVRRMLKAIEEQDAPVTQKGVDGWNPIAVKTTGTSRRRSGRRGQRMAR